MASHRASMKSSTACSTVTGWSAMSVGSIPTGRFAVISVMACATLRPRARTSPPLRMAMASPMPSRPLTRNIGCAGSAGPRVTCAMSPRRMIRPFGDEVDRQDVLLGPERARDADEDLLVPGLHDARGGDGVLGLQRGDQRGAVDPEARQLLGRELDVNALVLGPENVDLGDVRQLEQLLADVVDVVPQLPVREPVRGEAVDDAVGVAELVVEAGADDSLRQRVADVADLLAHLVPDVRHLRRGRRILQVDEDRGLARGRVALQVVQARRLLQLALEAVGDLLERVADRGARPCGLHHHGLDGEVRILAAPEPEVGPDARDHDDQHEIGHERTVPDRPFGEVEAFIRRLPGAGPSGPGAASARRR